MARCWSSPVYLSVWALAASLPVPRAAKRIASPRPAVGRLGAIGFTALTTSNSESAGWHLPTQGPVQSGAVVAQPATVPSVPKPDQNGHPEQGSTTSPALGESSVQGSIQQDDAGANAAARLDPPAATAPDNTAWPDPPTSSRVAGAGPTRPSSTYGCREGRGARCFQSEYRKEIGVGKTEHDGDRHRSKCDTYWGPSLAYNWIGDDWNKPAPVGESQHAKSWQHASASKAAARNWE